MKRRSFLTALASGLISSRTGKAQQSLGGSAFIPGEHADWSIVAADAGFGTVTSGDQLGDILIVRNEGGGRRALWRMPWFEDESDHVGHDDSAAVRLRAVGQNAIDPMVPVRDGQFWRDDRHGWLWREGAVVHALGAAAEHRTLILPGPPAAVLHPALHRSEGDLLVFSLSANRRRLDRLVFPRQTTVRPRIAASVALPLAVSAGTAAFGLGQSVLTGLSAASAGGTMFLLIDHAADGTPRQAVLRNAVPVTHAAPALRVEEDGSATLGVLVTTQTGIALAEAHFPVDRAAAPTVVQVHVGRFAAKPVAAALRYSSIAQSLHPRFYALVQLADRTLLHADVNGALVAARFEAPPVMPPVLVPTSHGAYALCCDPRTGPVMANV